MEFISLLKLLINDKKDKTEWNFIYWWGLGVLGLSDLIDFTEPIKNILSTVGLILMALPFPFYINDWIRILKKRKS